MKIRKAKPEICQKKKYQRALSSNDNGGGVLQEVRVLSNRKERSRPTHSTNR
jgi:hypothetical protein